MAVSIMEPHLYTKDFEFVDTLDVYTSLIWTERYNKVGDFEFHTTATTGLASEIVPGSYLVLNDSNAAMVVETVKITTNVENGNSFEVSGRSIESILDRRIVWDQTNLNSKLETAVQRLLNENVINPIDSARKIPGFVFKASEDVRLDAITVDKQFTGDTLLDAIQGMCVTAGVGWRITFTPDSETERFAFQLYLGENRAYSQEENPWVIFAPGFDNLISSNYTGSVKLIKNVAQIKGEGEGTDRKTATIIRNSDATGLNRRELYVDARDISQNKDSEDAISDGEYAKLLTARGEEKLAECEDEETFEGEAQVTDGIFIYGRDFYMGDILQLENEYEMTDEVRVTELIRSGDTSGFTVYPTFTSTNIKEEEVSST